MDPKLLKPFIDQYLEYKPRLETYQLKPQTSLCETCGDTCVDRRVEAQVMALGKKTQHVIHKCTACYQILYRGPFTNRQVIRTPPPRPTPAPAPESAPPARRGRPRKNPRVAITTKRSRGRPALVTQTRQEILIDTDEIRITQYHHDSTPE